MLLPIAIVVALLTVVYAIHRTLLWAEARGYVYYRTKSRPRAGSLGILEQIYRPELEHVIEEETSQAARREDDESGRGNDPE